MHTLRIFLMFDDLKYKCQIFVMEIPQKFLHQMRCERVSFSAAMITNHVGKIGHSKYFCLCVDVCDCVGVSLFLALKLPFSASVGHQSFGLYHFAPIFIPYVGVQFINICISRHTCILFLIPLSME